MLLTEAAQLNSDGDRGPDTVVIGSGAIGLYAASELAKHGQRVLVVESGGVHLGNFAPESYESVGFPHEGVRIARSRSLGGHHQPLGRAARGVSACGFRGPRMAARQRLASEV
jgi:choline dehydrogenase-like flavoprotein